MAFTYDPNLGTARDELRSVLADTVSATAKWTDAELDRFLTGRGNAVYDAAADALIALGNKYALVVDVQLGSKRMSGSQARTMLAEQAAAMREQGKALSSAAALPWAAGLSRAEVRDYYTDPDVPRPPDGAMAPEDYPGAGGTAWWDEQ